MPRKISVLLIIALVLTSLPINVSMVKAAGPSLVEAGDTERYEFEDGTTQGWQGYTLAVEAVNDAAAVYSGSYGLKVSNSTANSQGAYLDVSAFPAETYKIEAYVKLVSGDRGALKITHQYNYRGTEGMKRGLAADIRYEAQLIKISV